MKRVNIKVDSCFWKTGDGQCPETASFSLPDDIESVVVTEGDNYYTGTIFKLADNSYSYIAVVPLLNNIFIGNTLYSQLQGLLDAASIKDYIDINLLEEGLNGYNNRFEKSRLDLTADFRKLFLKLDDIYDYDLSVPIPDQKLLDVITKVWQNNSIENSPNADLNATYKKGDQITVSDQYSAYRTLFESAYGKTFADNNIWPGRHNETYFCAWQNSGFLTASLASADIATKALECFTTQCEQFEERFFDEEAATEYLADQQALVKSISDQIETLNDQLSDAEETLTDAVSSLDEAEQNLEDVTKEATSNYEECVKECDGDPACIADCAATRDAAIATAQANVDAAQAAVDKAQAAVDAIQGAISVLEEQQEEINNLITQLQAIQKQISEICSSESQARSGINIPEDAFDLLQAEAGGLNELFEQWMKYQTDGAKIGAMIQQSVGNAIGIDGELTFVESGGTRYAMIKQTILVQDQIMEAAKAIKEAVSSQA